MADLQHPSTHSIPCDCGKCDGQLFVCLDCAALHSGAGRVAKPTDTRVECECECHAWNEFCDKLVEFGIAQREEEDEES